MQHRMTRRARASLLAVLMAVGLAACTSTSGGPTPPPTTGSDDSSTITIAVEGPALGSQGPTGQDMFRAAQLAVDQANANAGVGGKTVELLKLDDQAEPVPGVDVANQAVAAHAFAVIGPYNSSVGLQNLPIYLDGNVIPIHLTSTAQTDGMGYTIQPKDYQVAPIEAEAIDGWLKAKRVAIIYDTSAYTAGVATQLKNSLEGDGVDIVDFQKFRTGTLTVKPAVHRLLQAKPDLIYASTYFPEGTSIAKELLGQKDVQCFMGLANQDSQFIASAGQEAAANCMFSGVPSPEQFPGAADYVKAYEERFHVQAGTWGTFTYDSVNLLFDAVHEAGGWDHEKVNAALTGTKNWEGATGTVSIDARTGNRVDVPVVVLKVADTAFEIDKSWARYAGFDLAPAPPPAASEAPTA